MRPYYSSQTPKRNTKVATDPKYLELQANTGKKVGKNLRRIRQSRNISQMELARRTGYDATTFVHIEAGRNCDVSGRLLVLICAALDCQPAELYARGSK